MNRVTRVFGLAVFCLMAIMPRAESIEIHYKSLNVACDGRWVAYDPGNWVFVEAEPFTDFVCDGSLNEDCEFKFWTFKGKVDGVENTSPYIPNRSHVFESSGTGQEGPHPVAWYWCHGGGSGPPSIALVAINLDDNEVISPPWIQETDPLNFPHSCNTMTCGTGMVDPVSGESLISVTAKNRVPYPSVTWELQFIQWNLDGVLQAEGETTLLVGDAGLSHFAIAYYQLALIETPNWGEMLGRICKDFPRLCPLPDICERYPRLCPKPIPGEVIIVERDPVIIDKICWFVSGGIRNCPGCEGGPFSMCAGDLRIRGVRDETIIILDRNTGDVIRWEEVSPKRLNKRGDMVIKLDHDLLSKVGGLDQLSMMILPGTKSKPGKGQEITLDWQPH